MRISQRFRIYGALLLQLSLTACATSTLPIDRSYKARSQSSRVKFLIIHYTAGNTASSLRTLTQEGVSSHYLVTDDDEPVVYGLVDETQQANHAGVSSWKNNVQLNSNSIGIEIVNRGARAGAEGTVWQPFPQAQIEVLIALIKDIVHRHGIPSENILGHSEIAPQRKPDPGPAFPWSQLARAGLVWAPDNADLARAVHAYENSVPDVLWFQQKLALHGYAVPQSGELDAATGKVLRVFQMRYRPCRIDGIPDAQTAALLDLITKAKAEASKPTI